MPTPADPCWFQALTLDERAALPVPVERWDPELAARRLQRWRSQPPFADPALFALRLAADGLAEERLLRLLGEPPAALAARCPEAPDWLEDLEQALAGPAGPWPGMERERSDFLAAASPLLAWGCRRLERGAAALKVLAEKDGPGAPFDSTAPGALAGIFFPRLLFPLNLLLSRTLAVELHIAGLEGRLAGETPEERFRSFLALLSPPEELRALLARYPVLARQLIVCVRQWADASLETLARLAGDRREIRALFFPEAPDAGPGRLAALEGTGGDLHRGGRAVAVLVFESGERLVYKPKPLAVDVHFQELLAWVDARGGAGDGTGDAAPFRRLRVLDRGAYGWQEHAAPAECASPAELRRFYRRTGGLLALLYALEATDVHMENLIAAGEHPVLVDLESLFHLRADRMSSGMPGGRAGAPAERTMGHSVLRVGLLPQRTDAGGEEGYDLSGLGGAEGQVSALPLPSWEGEGTDGVRLVRRRLRAPGSHNRPRLSGEEASALDHGEEIVAGFAAVHRILADGREELLAPGGPVARFADDEVRAIVRPTMSYARLLQESCHPHVLQNGLERDRLLDRLWEVAAKSPLLNGLIPAEQRDLRRGDVPLFTTRPGSRDLRDGEGRSIPGFADEPALDSVRRRVAGLDEADRVRQVWFIRASLATLALNGDDARLPRYEVVPPRRSAGREELIAAARAVGDRLEALAVRGEEDVSWIGLTMAGFHWSLVPMGPDLYAGLTGVALFLAQLGAVTGEARYSELAAAALGTARRQLAGSAAGGEALPAIGAFSGWGGVVYALIHLAALWNDPALLDEAEAYAAGPLSGLLDGDELLDLMGGAAGGLASLLALHAVRPSPQALALAVRCGEHLLARAVPQEEGVGWTNGGSGDRPLAGFSHGAGGAAWALASLASATGGGRFREAAEAAIRYERTLFVPAAGNWRDLRPIPRPAGAPEAFMTAWCHGAPGVALSRLRLLAHLDDPAFLQEIEAALATTLESGFGLNHSLCHGDLGNLEPLLLAGSLLGDRRWEGEVARLSAVVLESVERDGWLCGVPEGVETPGLMTGLAGIGYGLLRLADPGRVPSVLAFEGPRRS